MNRQLSAGQETNKVLTLSPQRQFSQTLRQDELASGMCEDSSDVQIDLCYMLISRDSFLALQSATSVLSDKRIANQAQDKQNSGSNRSD